MCLSGGSPALIVSVLSWLWRQNDVAYSTGMFVVLCEVLVWGFEQEQGAELHVTWRCNATILYRGCSLQFFYQPGSWSLGVGVGGTNSVSAPIPLFPPRTLLTVRQLHIPTFANAL